MVVTRSERVRDQSRVVFTKKLWFSNVHLQYKLRSPLKTPINSYRAVQIWCKNCCKFLQSPHTHVYSACGMCAWLNCDLFMYLEGNISVATTTIRTECPLLHRKTSFHIRSKNSCSITLIRHNKKFAHFILCLFRTCVSRHTKWISVHIMCQLDVAGNIDAQANVETTDYVKKKEWA